MEFARDLQCPFSKHHSLLATWQNCLQYFAIQPYPCFFEVGPKPLTDLVYALPLPLHMGTGYLLVRLVGNERGHSNKSVYISCQRQRFHWV